MKKILSVFLQTLSIILLSSVLLFYLFGFQVVFSKDDSLPYRIYISKPLKAVKRGIIVTFYHTESKRFFGKRVVGVPGDAVDLKDGNIIVAGKNFGKVMKTSKSGRMYHPISPCVIPDGYYFLCGTHEYSFDSRYQELGLISENEFKREMWPLF